MRPGRFCLVVCAALASPAAGRAELASVAAVDPMVDPAMGPSPFAISMRRRESSHGFDWKSMASRGGGEPSGALKEALEASFESSIGEKHNSNLTGGGAMVAEGGRTRRSGCGGLKREGRSTSAPLRSSPRVTMRSADPRGAARAQTCRPARELSLEPRDRAQAGRVARIRSGWASIRPSMVSASTGGHASCPCEAGASSSRKIGRGL